MEKENSISLPTRRFVKGSLRHNLIDPISGFLNKSIDTLSTSDILSHSAVLVTAPPWMGKSTIAAHLTSCFQNQIPEVSVFGKYFESTNFERRLFSGLTPNWWNDWVKTSSRACWIIDAIDEDERKEDRTFLGIIELIEKLDKEHLKSLCVLVFCRESEVPVTSQKKWFDVYNAKGIGAPLEVCLAPFSVEDARDFVGPASFDMAQKLIERNSLQSVSGYPAALDYIKRCPPDVQLTVVEIWAGVLKELMCDKRISKSGANHGIDEQFRAACWLAAILTFSGQSQIDDGAGKSTWHGVDQLIPIDINGRSNLAYAGRQCLKTAIFQYAVNSYRFAQQHVREWMAAFGVSDLSLTQLRPLVTKQNGALQESIDGIMALLRLTTKHAEVKNWITLQYGGIPPRSDAAPWGLEEATVVLDELLKIAANTESVLWLDNNRGLNNLYAPGLSKVLSERLGSKLLTDQQKIFVFEVAKSTKSVEVINRIEGIIFDCSESIKVRNSAAGVLFSLGTTVDHKRIGDRIKKGRNWRSDEYALIGSVIYFLYKSKIWDYSVSVKYAPPPANDQMSMLHYVLERDLTISRARQFLSCNKIDFLLSQLVGSENILNSYDRSGGLLIPAVRIVSNQVVISEQDCRLLVPVVMNFLHPGWSGHLPYEAMRKVRECQSVRREVLAYLIANNTKLCEEIFPWLAVPDDVEWILEKFCKHAIEIKLLWDYLLKESVARISDDRVYSKVREEIERRYPGMVGEYDKGREKIRLREEKFKQKDKEIEVNAPKEYQIQEVVDNVLGANFTLSVKLHTLSWYCLEMLPFRPRNIIGTWEDLREDTRCSVLEIFARALSECTPTPIPDGNQYPAAIGYEANAFYLVNMNNVDGYCFDVHQVRKWMPAVLKFGNQTFERNNLLKRAVQVDPNALCDVLIEEITRRLRSEPGSLFFVEELPTEVWTSKLSEKIVRLLSVDEYDLNVRARIARVVALKFYQSIHDLIEEWLGLGFGDKRFLVAIDILFIHDSDRPIKILAGLPESDLRESLLEIESLCESENLAELKLSDWSSLRLAQLEEILFRAFPESSDPEIKSGEVLGPDYTLRRIRDRIPVILWERQNTQDIEILDRLSIENPSLLLWLKEKKAGVSVEKIIQSIASPRLDYSGKVSVVEVVRILERSCYRAIRNSSDLQMVLMEELIDIHQDIAQHLSMLYYLGKDRTRINLNEDALQSYYYCRLSDRLSNRVLNESASVKFINREALSQRDGRLDIKVETNTIDGQRACVVIEIKWSSNKSVSTSLTDQLGQKYLVGGGQTHGIYLVCLNGKMIWPKSILGRPEDHSDIDEWLHALTLQAKNFQQLHPTYSIVPLVVDVRWRQEAS